MHITGTIWGDKNLVPLIIVIVLASSLFFVLNPVSLLAQNANDTTTLGVNVSVQAAIEVLPTAVNWYALIPGSNGTAGLSDDIRNLSIRNVGSYNLTNFYVDVNTEDLETTNPLGPGNISKYAASGFIRFRNETTTTDYMHLGRIEWNLTEDLDTETLNLSSVTTKYGHGWYRRANGNEYMWKVENGTGGWCNNTATYFIIKNYPENSSGYQRDLSTNFATASVSNNNTNWTFLYFGSGPLYPHCVAVYYDCTKVYIYKYDMDGGTAGTSFGSCALAKFITEDELAPGEKIDKLKVKPSIPYGTPYGDAIQSTMTIFTYII